MGEGIENNVIHDMPTEEHIHDDDKLYDDVYQHVPLGYHEDPDEKIDALKENIVMGEVFNSPRFKKPFKLK